MLSERPEAPLELGEGLVGSLEFDPGVPALPNRLDHTSCSVQFLSVTNTSCALYIKHYLSIWVHESIISKSLSHQRVL